MQYGATGHFTAAFAGSAPSAQELDADDLQPRLHPLTLSFRSRLLELDYVATMRRQTAAVVRFGILLALVVYLLFGALDLWAVEENQRFTWTMRAVVFVLTAVLFGASFTPLFAEFREVIVVPFCLLLGLGVTAILAAMPAAIADQYYVGYILIIVGAHTVLGLRFINATSVSLALFAMYLATEFLFRDDARAHVLSNSTFILSALIISGVGGYIYERQRRLAHYRLRVIERERARSEHSALHDALTGLPNRRLLMERLEHALVRDERFRTFAALIFIDLDAFKPVNDTWGHVFGDKLLRGVAERLLTTVRDTDTVARLGGDEFVVLLEDLADASSVEWLRDRIQERFEEPFEIDGTRLLVRMSMGCALHPSDGRTPRELLQAADRAMYCAKRRHGRR